MIEDLIRIAVVIAIPLGLFALVLVSIKRCS